MGRKNGKKADRKKGEARSGKKHLNEFKGKLEITLLSGRPERLPDFLG